MAPKPPPKASKVSCAGLLHLVTSVIGLALGLFVAAHISTAAPAPQAPEAAVGEKKAESPSQVRTEAEDMVRRIEEDKKAAAYVSEHKDTLPPASELIGVGSGEWVLVGPVGYNKDRWSAALLAYKRADWTNAFHFFEESAKSGRMDAKYALSIMYGRGQGVLSDQTKADLLLTELSGGEVGVAAAITNKALEDLRSDTNYPAEVAASMRNRNVGRLGMAAGMGNKKAREAVLKLDKVPFSGGVVDYPWDKAFMILSGIKGVYVDCTLLDEGAGLLSKEALKTTVELRLRSAGIAVSEMNSFPKLRVEVQAMKVGDGSLYAAHIKVELYDIVEYRFKTTGTSVWDWSVLTWAGKAVLFDHLKGKLEGAVDRFANDFLKANPK